MTKKSRPFILSRIFIIIISFCISVSSFAGSNEFVLPKGNIVMLAPPVVNKDYFLLEFGFVTGKEIKSWSYKYNAYVTAALFQDWKDTEGKLRAGALGFKGGVMLPTQPWIPFLITGTFGFAKTALHKNPFLGRDESSVAQKTMILLEAGALYHYDKYFIRYAYQRSNVKYFSRYHIFMFGVNY